MPAPSPSSPMAGASALPPSPAGTTPAAGIVAGVPDGGAGFDPKQLLAILPLIFARNPGAKAAFLQGWQRAQEQDQRRKEEERRLALEQQRIDLSSENTRAIIGEREQTRAAAAQNDIQRRAQDLLSGYAQIVGRAPTLRDFDALLNQYGDLLERKFPGVATKADLSAAVGPYQVNEDRAKRWMKKYESQPDFPQMLARSEYGQWAQDNGYLVPSEGGFAYNPDPQVSTTGTLTPEREVIALRKQAREARKAGDNERAAQLEAEADAITKDTKAFDVNSKRPPVSSGSETDINEAARNIVNNPTDLLSMRYIVSLRGDQRIKLYNEIKRLNPDFDPGMIDRRVKFLDAYEDPKGRAAINRGAMNNILMHSADLHQVNQEYQRQNARILNAPVNAIKSQYSADWVKFVTPLTVLEEEIALYFAGGYAPQADQQRRWQQILNGDATPKQIEEFAKSIIHVGLRRADTFNEQFKTMMGYDDPNMLTPAAVAAGNSLGLGQEMQKYGSGGMLPGGGTSPVESGRVRVQGPNGETGTVPAGTELPPGWKVVG